MMINNVVDDDDYDDDGKYWIWIPDRMPAHPRSVQGYATMYGNTSLHWGCAELRRVSAIWISEFTDDSNNVAKTNWDEQLFAESSSFLFGFAMLWLSSPIWILILMVFLGYDTWMRNIQTDKHYDACVGFQCLCKNPFSSDLLSPNAPHQKLDPWRPWRQKCRIYLESIPGFTKPKIHNDLKLTKWAKSKWCCEWTSKFVTYKVPMNSLNHVWGIMNHSNT